MKVKTKELTGAALDWAVAKCMGQENCWMHDYKIGYPVSISTDWSQAGPIIEREKLDVHPMHPKPAWAKEESWAAHTVGRDLNPVGYGSTPLIAAMRCYVASKLGDEVEVPDDFEREVSPAPSALRKD